VAAAVGIGAAAITIGRRSLHWSPPAAPRYLMTAITVAAVVAAGSVVAAHNAPAGARAPREFPVRMVSYNIRMGFSLDGRFDPDALAATINRERPDVVLLSEVDRGWFLNGGHDDLQLLADRLGMRALFAPAADPVWGDALLTRLPIVSIRSHPLPRAGAPIGATAIAAVVSVGGQELGVVGVHLQAPSGELPTVQATAVADIAQDLARGGRPVVVAGDMNITPQSREFASLLASGLRDGFADVRPFRTFPADHPTEEIDHVFTTPNLGVTDATVPDGTGSDHRAVAVTLSLRDPA
jgi:endonuclease/exonuclease/phosphatase family metal-dependent hydrolase